jgi:hypothetical protein
MVARLPVLTRARRNKRIVSEVNAMSRTINGMAGIVHTAGPSSEDRVHLSRTFPFGAEPETLTRSAIESVLPDRVLPLGGDDWDEDEDEFFDDDEDDEDDDEDDAFGDDEDDFDDDEEEDDDED